MTDPATKGPLGHILRVAVCLLTFGFIFPHALMENEDAAKLVAKEKAALVKDTAGAP